VHQEVRVRPSGPLAGDGELRQWKAFQESLLQHLKARWDSLRRRCVGRQVLRWWPDDGCQRGSVARLCPRPAPARSRTWWHTRGRRDGDVGAARHGGLAARLCLSRRPAAAALPAAAVGVPGRAAPPHDFGLACISSQSEPDGSGPEGLLSRTIGCGRYNLP
jgi:hypothetical protein